MNRRHFATALMAILAGLAKGAGNVIASTARAETKKEPKHVCKGLNECRGQGHCLHGCSNHGCAGKNDCKGQGGCAAPATHHGCKGKNTCKAIGGCASGDNGCAGFNSCKGVGGCEVPLNYEHERPRYKSGKRK